jgi:hypothetical protein
MGVQKSRHIMDFNKLSEILEKPAKADNEVSQIKRESGTASKGR